MSSKLTELPSGTGLSAESLLYGVEVQEGSPSTSVAYSASTLQDFILGALYEYPEPDILQIATDPESTPSINSFYGWNYGFFQVCSLNIQYQSLTEIQVGTVLGTVPESYIPFLNTNVVGMIDKTPALGDPPDRLDFTFHIEGGSGEIRLLTQVSTQEPGLYLHATWFQIRDH